MSFELTPRVAQANKNDNKRHSLLRPRRASVNETVFWSQSRNGLPHLLQGRVDLDTWRRTFYLVDGLYKKLLEQRDESPFPLIDVVFPPLCNAKLEHMAAQHEARWNEVLESQVELYREVGVHVAPIKDRLCICRGGKEMEVTVGLEFDVAPLPPSSRSTNGGAGCLAMRIRHLEKLYQRGVISASECNRSYEKLGVQRVLDIG